MKEGIGRFFFGDDDDQESCFEKSSVTLSGRNLAAMLDLLASFLFKYRALKFHLCQYFLNFSVN